MSIYLVRMIVLNSDIWFVFYGSFVHWFLLPFCILRECDVYMLPGRLLYVKYFSWSTFLFSSQGIPASFGCLDNGIVCGKDVWSSYVWSIWDVVRKEKLMTGGIMLLSWGWNWRNWTWRGKRRGEYLQSAYLLPWQKCTFV